MNPTNSGRAKDKGCNPVSSNCVVWQGPDLGCIDLCKGDTISDVVYKMATELCELLDMFEIGDFDFSCLELQPSSQPTNVQELIQVLIDRICALEGITPGGGAEVPDCPENCIVPLADCFYYIDEGTGDTVTTAPLLDYVNLIGNRICDLIDDITILQGEVDTLQEQINGTGGLAGKVEANTAGKVDKTALDYQLSSETTAGAPIKFITAAVRDIENSLIATKQATGTPTQLYQNMLKQGNISEEDRLATIGLMSSIPGWTVNPTVSAESIGNIWLAIHDIRTAVQYIQENCCSTGCSDLFLNFRASLNVTEASTLLTIFTDGSTGFSSEWVQCSPTGTNFTVVDGLGNSSSFKTDIIDLMDIPGGFTVDLTPTSIDPTTDLTVTAFTCFSNNQSLATCEKEYKYTIYASADCPSTVLTVYTTSVAYQFSPTSGYSYIINVYTAGSPTPVAAQIVATPGVIVANSIAGLTSETDYELEVVIVDSEGSQTPCARQPFTTLPSDCTPPTGSTAILTT